MTPEQKAKLTPEQLVIAEKWEKDREEMSRLIEQFTAATGKKDMKLWTDTMDKIVEITPSMCEHDRSLWSNCAACDEIERVLHPHLFCAECGIPFDMVSSEETEKEHKEGDICPDCSFEKE